jgi:hypothetical protein
MPIEGEPVATVTNIWRSRAMRACRTDLEWKLGRRLSEEPLDMKIRRALILLSAAAAFANLSMTAKSQSVSFSDGPISATASPFSEQFDLTYVRPTHRTKAKNYLFDALGPYPIVGASAAAGINQLSNAPPEWRQGAEAFSKRLGSDFAIATIGTSTRFGLAEALKEDTLYYRCDCSGVWPRMAHAVTSTLTARRGEDGHPVFSVPALIAPYAGTMTAVYGWYPNRFGAKDAFRMGNYSLLANIGGNIALEFLYGGNYSLLSRMHLHKGQSAPVEQASQ